MNEKTREIEKVLNNPKLNFNYEKTVEIIFSMHELLIENKVNPVEAMAILETVKTFYIELSVRAMLDNDSP